MSRKKQLLNITISGCVVWWVWKYFRIKEQRNSCLPRVKFLNLLLTASDTCVMGLCHKSGGLRGKSGGDWRGDGRGGVTHWSPSNYCLGAGSEWGRWPRLDGNSDMARTNKQYRRLQNSASPLAPPYRRNPSARDQSFPNTALGSGRLGEGGGGALCLLTTGHFCPCY